MRGLLLTPVILLGCHVPPVPFSADTVVWPDWVSTAYAPLDDAGVIVNESDVEIITQHESDAMACGGTYLCLVGWRKTSLGRDPIWIECDVETEPSVWTCIHAQQPRPRFRFALRTTGPRWKAEDPVSLTPWIDAVLEAIRAERIWHTFQICGGNLSVNSYVADVMGWFDGDDEWSNREVTAVLDGLGVWRTTWLPRRQ